MASRVFKKKKICQDELATDRNISFCSKICLIVLQTLTKTQVEGIEGGVDTLEDDQFGPSTSNPPDTDVATTCVEGATIPEHQTEDEGTDNESVVTRICLKDQVKKGKTRKHAMDNDEEIQVKFLKMEEEKKEELKTYRQKKIELLEKNVLATEKIADNLAKILDSLSNTQIITYENEK
ncbi:unnamed protein product [Mytilus coruscus]|uniref:CARD domain-containing protein n=1 Tax=Mytilus coruscus TaxID=42192 RepID=A0A6J8A6D4_MYTCO|nr:unnamed protein product [Mytilus coruscus]